MNVFLAILGIVVGPVVIYVGFKLASAGWQAGKASFMRRECKKYPNRRR